jgi:COMPASS component SWD3
VNLFLIHPVLAVVSWDDRTGRSVRSIFGPHICGDALDCNASGSELLTGSWREEHALQRWDYGSGKLIADVNWHGSAHAQAGDASASASHSGGQRVGASAMLYACAYSPDDRLIAAGGAGNGLNQAKLFNAHSGEVLERVSFNHALYTLAFSADSKQLAMGGVDAALTIVNL